MNTLYLNRKAYPIPGTWAELSQRQLLELIALLQRGLPALEVKLRALLVLLDCRKNKRAGLLLFQVDKESLPDLLRLTEFLELGPRFTDQKFRQVGELLGPDDNFSNLVFYEYIQAEAHYLEFSKKPKELEHLDRMIAVLWRRPAASPTPADAREKYEDKLLARRLATVKDWPLAQKIAVYVWFDNCRQGMIAAFPKVFNPPTKKGGFNPTARPKGWLDVATNLAENITNVEEVLYTDLYLVMLFLSNQLEAQEAQEEIMNRSR